MDKREKNTSFPSDSKESPKEEFRCGIVSKEGKIPALSTSLVLSLDSDITAKNLCFCNGIYLGSVSKDDKPVQQPQTRTGSRSSDWNAGSLSPFAVFLDSQDTTDMPGMEVDLSWEMFPNDEVVPLTAHSQGNGFNKPVVQSEAEKSKSQRGNSCPVEPEWERASCSTFRPIYPSVGEVPSSLPSATRTNCQSAFDDRDIRKGKWLPDAEASQQQSATLQAEHIAAQSERSSGKEQRCGSVLKCPSERTLSRNGSLIRENTPISLALRQPSSEEVEELHSFRWKKEQLDKSNNYLRALNDMCVCASEINRLQRELQKSRDQIMAISLQMEEQSSHLHMLMSDRDNMMLESTGCRSAGLGYALFSNGGCRPSCSYSGVGNCRRYPVFQRSSATDPISQSAKGTHLRTMESEDIDSLRDQVLNLQMQNVKLSHFLQQEGLKRQEMEDAYNREKEYVKKLEENIKSLRATRVVIDPDTYRQMADQYIAARKTPVRRTHTYAPCRASDLVCDVTHPDDQLRQWPDIREGLQQSASCPSSPHSQTRPTAVGVRTGKNSFARTSAVPQGLSPDGSGSVLRPDDYEDLIKSLEDLNNPSSPS